MKRKQKQQKDNEKILLVILIEKYARITSRIKSIINTELDSEFGNDHDFDVIQEVRPLELNKEDQESDESVQALHIFIQPKPKGKLTRKFTEDETIYFDTLGNGINLGEGIAEAFTELL